jgi:hypothetical protein
VENKIEMREKKETLRVSLCRKIFFYSDREKKGQQREVILMKIIMYHKFLWDI